MLRCAVCGDGRAHSSATWLAASPKTRKTCDCEALPRREEPAAAPATAAELSSILFNKAGHAFIARLDRATSSQIDLLREVCCGVRRARERPPRGGGGARAAA